MSSTLSADYKTEQDRTGAVPGELVLRVSGGGYENDTVRLPERKITVGSGAKCSLRLRSGNVAPLHCMILRGSTSTAVRSWDKPMIVDGQAISETFLDNGMCLQLGDVQLQVAQLYGDAVGPDTEPADDNTKPADDNTKPADDDTEPAGDDTEPAGDDTEPAGDDADTSPTFVSGAGDICRCDHCETKIAAIEARLAGIEQRLESLADSTYRVASQVADSEEDGSVRRAAETPVRADSSDGVGLPLATMTEEAAYGVCPVGSRDRGPHGSENAKPGTSNEPSWADSYQDDDGVDESVRDYVERLLQRVGNGSQRKDESSSQSPPARNWTAEPSETAQESSVLAALISGQDEDERSPAPSVAPTPSTATVAANPEGISAEPYAPRSFPPERVTSLAEMREVANVTAEEAIRAFEMDQASKNASHRLPMMLVGLVCGLALLFLAILQSPGLTQVLLFATGAVSLLAGGGAGWQALSALRRPKSTPGRQA